MLVSDPELEFGAVDLKPENYSDMAMAELFAKVCKNIIRYNPATDWLVWNGRVWEMSELKAQQRYIEFIKKVLDTAKLEMFKNADDEDEESSKKAKAYYKYILKMCDAGKISAVMKLAKSYLEIEIEELDANPFDLNTPEGIIDLKTGQMRPHDPSCMCTKMTMFSPSDGGEKMWDDFLDVTQNDKEFKNYLQYIAGQAVIGKIYHEGVVIAHGDGANGKSTLFNTIFDVLGDYSGKIPAEALTTKVKNAKVDLAELLGKRFILASETEEGVRLSIGMLKQIASVDDIVAEKKYHDPFTFTPSHLTVLYTNYLPKVGSNDKGTWRRLIVAPFNADIANPQKDFAEKLNVSRQAISRWENGTALPDAQNILQISKLFNVTTDYLLNDDYESDNDIPAVKTATAETDALFLKKKNLHLVAAISFTIASLCWIIGMANSTHDAATVLFGISFALSAFNAAAQFVLYFRKR